MSKELLGGVGESVEIGIVAEGIANRREFDEFAVFELVEQSSGPVLVAGFYPIQGLRDRITPRAIRPGAYT